MIQIKIEDIEQLKEEFFNSVFGHISSTVAFYRLCLDVLNGTRLLQDILDDPMDTNTKTALLTRIFSNITARADHPNAGSLDDLEPEINTHLAAFTDLIDHLMVEANVRAVVLATPKRLLAEQTTLKNIFDFGTGAQDIRKKVINIIFNYAKLSSFSPLNAYQLIERIGVKTCVYCNRTYTTVIEAETKPPLDHFHDQGDNPYLALSFYNLIPSCDLCNSRFKIAKTFKWTTHIHPYIEEFGRYGKFNYRFSGLKSDLYNPANYVVTIDKNGTTTKKKKIAKNIEVFKLEKVYQSHTDIVSEIVGKTDEDSEYYLGDVISRHKDLHSNFGEIYRFYFGNYYYIDEHHKRPLGKLTRDIFDRQKLKSKMKKKK